MPPTARWRFALFYFWYYAALGAYTPYIGRWVDSLGHGGFIIGTMLGLWYGGRVLGPPLWTAVSQGGERPGRWLIAGSLLTLLAFSGFTRTHEVIGLLTVMALFGLFFNAVMPQFEAMTLTALGERTHDYGKLRLWGSVGFLLTASSYGTLLDRFGDAAFPWLTLPLLAAMVLSSLPHRHSRPPPPGPDLHDAGHLWKRPGVRRFLLVAMLMQLGFGPFYVFYTLHMRANGHDGTAVGLLWAVGVLVEIVLFWLAPSLIARFGAPRLLTACMAVTLARWVVTALFAGSFGLMLLAQSAHALGFAVFHACCMRLMAEYFPGRRQAAGQSLLYGFSSGVGGVLGAGMAAVLWEAGGGQWAFLGGAACVAAALLVYAARRAPASPGPG